MFYQDISPDEQSRTEPAARYNAVNRMLREYSGQSDPVYPSFSPGLTVIDFMNSSSGTIGAFTAVRILANLPPQSSGELDGRWEGQCIVCGVPAYDENEPWGIALDEVEPQEYGRMALAGTVPAVFSGSGRKVTPSPDGLVAGDSGSAWIVAQPAESYPERESFPGVILLGGGSGSVESYYGPFKLRAKSETELEVFNGALEDASYCGITDLPGLREVPRCTLSITDGSKHPVYICFFYSENDGYSVKIDTQKPDEALLWHLLGYFHNGAVTQAYKNLGPMFFGDQWYLHVRDTV